MLVRLVQYQNVPKLIEVSESGMTMLVSPEQQ